LETAEARNRNDTDMWVVVTVLSFSCLAGPLYWLFRSDPPKQEADKQVITIPIPANITQKPMDAVKID
jgi:hypothetical protein